MWFENHNWGRLSDDPSTGVELSAAAYALGVPLHEAVSPERGRPDDGPVFPHDDLWRINYFLTSLIIARGASSFSVEFLLGLHDFRKNILVILEDLPNTVIVQGNEAHISTLS